MSKRLILIIAILILAGGGIWYFSSNDRSRTPQQKTTDSSALIATVPEVTGDNQRASGAKGEAMMKSSEHMMSAGVYEEYAPEKVAMAAAHGKVVLYFHAPWCPICRSLDADIKAHLSDIPKDLSILQVDYDTSTALKQKYAVTYQHTFVEVNADGSLVKKWAESFTLADVVAKVQ